MLKIRGVSSITAVVVAAILISRAAISAPDEPVALVPRDASHDMMCGPHCLWLVTNHYGKTINLAGLAAMAHTDPYVGTTAENMVTTLRGLGLHARTGRFDLDELLRSGRLSILIVRDDAHYVLLLGADVGTVSFADGASKRTVKRTDFKEYWRGIAIVVGDKPFPLPWTRPLIATVIAAIGIVTAAAMFRRRKSSNQGESTDTGRTDGSNGIHD